MTLDKEEKRLWKHGLPRCDHRDAHAVITTTAAGSRSVREQCQTCGKVDPAPLRLADYPDASPADQPRADAWRTLRTEAGYAAQALARQRHAIRTAAKPAERADFFTEYSEFLAGDEWAAMRQTVLRRDGGRCQAALPGCTRAATEVHHLSYRYHGKIGMEPAYNLRSLCHECHEAITAADRAK